MMYVYIPLHFIFSDYDQVFRLYSVCNWRLPVQLKARICETSFNCCYVGNTANNREKPYTLLLHTIIIKTEMFKSGMK